MNADQLLAHYERIADAPAAIARLRRFILDLAVRGKLVPQLPTDEPASELLKQILVKQSERTNERRAGQNKPERTRMNQPPFSIPRSWIWTRLGSIAELVRGISFSASDRAALAAPGLVPCFRSGNIQAEIVWGDFIYVPREVLRNDRQLVRAGDILISIANSYDLVGKCSLIKKVQEPATFGAFLAAIRLHVGEPEYFRQFLSCEYSANAFRAGSAQTTNIANITFATIRGHLVPMPPLSEQRRIASKVNELMSLCDRLEKARSERETMRDRLTATSFACLSAPDPETFLHDASFALGVLPVMTKRSDQIKQLRNCILDLAVCGKSVPPDANDEPASELLKRMAEDKARSVATGEIRKEKAVPQLLSSSIPFEIPQSWEWIRLETVALKISDGEHLSPSKTKSGMPLLTATHVTASGVTLKDSQYVLWEDGQKFRERCDPRRGDILICSRGTIGRCAVVEIDEVFCLMGSVIQLRLPPLCLPKYVRLYLSTDRAQAQMRGMSGATAVSALYLKDLRLCPIPLPPVAEQHRIVTKVDELLAVCDRLEANLTQAEISRSRLLESLLHEALAPTQTEAA